MIDKYIGAHAEGYGIEPICAVLKSAGVQVVPRARLHPLPDASGQPDQLPRLLELEVDLHRRIELAQARGWLGEIAGLQTTLIHLAHKKTRRHG